MKNQVSYSQEVRERALRLVFEQQKEHESLVDHQIDRIEDWLYSGDAASVGKTCRN
ncbi:hypothetical protein SAMN05428978_106611 [Nitrosomonas sp. Nm34]|nr:hypothetical protein SAMN05428978_106611 [Nitrosomonas sp. Nm34]